MRPKGCDPTRTACANLVVVGPKMIGTFGERFVAGDPLQNDHRRVGRGHRAQHRVWAAECYNLNTGKRIRGFEQREWYLSKPRILIVDRWNISAGSAAAAPSR